MTNPNSINYAATPTTTTIGDWSLFFTNSKNAYCPVTSCSLKNLGCVNAFTSTKLQISANVNLVAVNNENWGWQETVCIICTNSAGGITYDTKYYDNYVVRQLPNPCTTALQINNSPLPSNPLAFTFNASPGLIGNWQTFVMSIVSPSCDPTSCTLFANGCVNSYASVYPTGKITMAATSPWTITALRNFQTEWRETVCISCTNGLDVVQIDNYQVVQSENMCFTALIAKSSPPPTNPKTFAFSASPSVMTVGTWTDFVAVASGVTGCDPTSCSLMAVGCLNTYASAYPSGRLTMADALTVQAQVNVFNGWSEMICIKCSNSANGQAYDTQFLDNYIVQQTKSPCHTSLGLPALIPVNPVTTSFHATNTLNLGT